MITLTTTPLTPSSIQIDWEYSTFDQETIVQKSTDGINWGIVLSPLPAGTNSVVATGLAASTKYYFKIKKQVWVGYSKANGDSSTLNKDPLEMFGSDLIAWYRSDDYISNVSSPARTAQWTDKSGNNRHLTEPVEANQPVNELGGTDSGQNDLDGHLGMRNSSAGVSLGNISIEINTADWGTAINESIIMISVMGGGANSNGQQYFFSRNQTGDSGDFSTLPYCLFYGTSSNFFRWSADGQGYRTQWTDRTAQPQFRSVIMSNAKSDISPMRTFFEGVEETNINSKEDSLSLPELDSLIFFRIPNKSAASVTNINNWETFFIKGDYTTLASKLNDIHSYYLNDRYPSMNIQNPNL